MPFLSSALQKVAPRQCHIYDLQGPLGGADSPAPNQAMFLDASEDLLLGQALNGTLWLCECFFLCVLCEGIDHEQAVLAVVGVTHVSAHRWARRWECRWADRLAPT